MVVVSFPSFVLISSNVLFCTACIKLLQARPVVILLLMVQITIHLFLAGRNGNVCDFQFLLWLLKFYIFRAARPMKMFLAAKPMKIFNAIERKNYCQFGNFEENPKAMFILKMWPARRSSRTTMRSRIWWKSGQFPARHFLEHLRWKQ